MSAVLVAGAAGFLGSVITERLAGRPDGVVAADILDDSGDGHAVKRERAVRLKSRAGIDVHRVDLTDVSATNELLAEARPWAVVNAAVFEPGRDALSVLLTAARAMDVRLFIHLSCADLYGPADRALWRASQPSSSPISISGTCGSSGRRVGSRAGASSPS